MANRATKKDRGRTLYGVGAPGNFALNTHAPRFADRRTKRNRSRAEIERKAVNESSSS
jgi:hypothetical protein